MPHVAIVLVTLFACVFPGEARAQVGGRASVGSTGAQGSWWSGWQPGTENPAISADGRFIVFSSPMLGLVPGDTNNRSDLFLRDRLLGTTTRISIKPDGSQADHDSDRAAITPDGRYVVFTSWARLTDGDTEASKDVFWLDRQTNTLRRVSVGLGGAQPNEFSFGTAVSANGSLVAFGSYATNLVATPMFGDFYRIYVRDMDAGVTELVSLTDDESAPNWWSDIGRTNAMSRDGRFVVFRSAATNLVAGDSNEQPDVFVRDRMLGTTTLVSVGGGGAPANGGSLMASISPDGRFVLFASTASNLVPGDTNAALDVFMRDLARGTTERVNLTGAEGQSGAGAGLPPFGTAFASMSADARYVVFESVSGDYVSGDTNGVLDVFLRDRVLGTTRRISVSGHGAQGDGESGYTGATISADGRWVTFVSQASNFVPGDTNRLTDIFVARNTVGPAAFWTSAGAGGAPRVRGFDLTGQVAQDFDAFPASMTGGVEVAVGDIDGDGHLDLVAAPGSGVPLVRVLHADNPAAKAVSGFVFEPSFTGGVTVAVGDTNGDGRDDVVVGRKSGGVAEVRVFTVTPSGAPALLANFVAYPGLTTGVRVAVGDLDADGRSEIVTSPGPGATGPVKLFTGRGIEIGSGFPFAPSSGDVHVAVGDVDGDRRAEIVVGGGAGIEPRVRVFHLPPAGGVSVLLDVNAYDAAFRGGARVASGDLDGDGRADLIVAPGQGMPALVRVTRLSQMGGLSERFNFLSLPSTFVGGSFVAAPPY